MIATKQACTLRRDPQPVKFSMSWAPDHRRAAPHEEAAGRALACGLAAGLLLSAGDPRGAVAATATASQGDLLEEYYAKAQATGSESVHTGTDHACDTEDRDATVTRLRWEQLEPCEPASRHASSRMSGELHSRA